MNYLTPNECVNPTYQASEDGDSHHYIEPMDWIQGVPPNAHYGAYAYDQGPVREEQSPGLRHRLRGTNIRDELPSRQVDVGQSADAVPSHEDATVRRHNSQLTTLKFRSAVVRQMDQNQLFELLSSNPDATSDEVRETLRNVNQSLTMKRQVKDRLRKEEARQGHKSVPFLKRVKYNCAMTCQHVQQEIWTLHKSLDLWHSHLKAVQGHFGSGVASYFYFLRRLFFLNLLGCVLILCFVVIPQAVWNSTSSSSSASKDSVPFGGYELLTGDGSFRNTLLYYGHYTNEKISGYRMPEAYLFTYTSYIICCIFILTFSVAKTYRINYIETAGDLKNVFAPKLLAAWDYTIERESSARLKSRSIYNELEELIAGQAQDSESVSFSSRFFVYVWRALINLIILAGMVATGYLVHWLLETQKHIIQVDIPVLKEMTLSLVVTAILFFVPFVFSLMSNWENYSSKQTQIYLNIVRVVMLRTIILAVVVTYWLQDWTRSSSEQKQEDALETSTRTAVGTTTGTEGDGVDVGQKMICWETRLGQEIYRLIVVDFLCILLLPTLVMEFLRRLFYDHCGKCVGYPEFDIAQNTLDLVYTQMLVWVGFFYSPLLPLIALGKLVIIFYIKRLSVIHSCHPPLKAWRAAHAQTLFLTLTFLCFMLSLLALGYSILTINPSDTCGPFRNTTTVYQTVLDLIGPTEDSNRIWKKVISPGVIAGVLLFLCVVVYYKRATAKAHLDMVKLLREQLTLEGKDKVFLLRLFEQAMEQQQICSYMQRNAQNNALNKDSTEPANYPKNAGSNFTKAVVSDVQDRNMNFENSHELPVDYSRPVPEEMSRRDRLAELKRESYGSRSTSRESSPFGQDGHRFNARDSPPYLRAPYGSNRSSPRDTSPYSGPSRYGYSDSPQDSMDRRGSQASQRVNQVPLLMKPPHQHGFRQLTPGPQNGSRQSTPQRY